MSGPSSPSHFYKVDEENLYDADFTKSISQQMRVPKKIRGTGDISDDDNNLANGHLQDWGMRTEKFDMQVPDRIMVVGQEQHMGAKSQPIEIVLENSTMPQTDPGTVRVGTPPRVLTLSDHYFPAADDPPMYNTSPPMKTNPPLRGGLDDDERGMVIQARPKSSFQIVQREATPPIGPAGEGLTTSEEVLHLRRQLAKLNRRVLAVEVDYLQRQQKDKVMYAVGIAYLVLKVVMWLTKS